MKSDRTTKNPPGFSEYNSLHFSIVERLRQRHLTDATLFRLMTAHAAYQIAEHKNGICSCPGPKDIFYNHKKIKVDGPETLDAEYSRDSLVLSITLLDSFLTDVCRFLFLHNPKSLPKDRQVKVTDVLNAENQSSLITGIVEKYVQEIAYKSIEERTKSLMERFGIEVNGIEERLEKLRPLIETRNELIHTISQFQYRTTDGGTVSVEHTPRPKVTWEVAEETLELVLQIVETLSTAISIKIFGKSPEIRIRETQ